MSASPEGDALEALAADVVAADQGVLRATTDRLAPYRPQAGRLVDVAAWWAAVTHPDPVTDPSGDGGVEAVPEPAPPRTAGLLTLGTAHGQVLAPPADATVSRLPSVVPEEVPAALEWGRDAADAAADAGVDVLLLAVADGTRSRVLAASLMGQDPVEAVGWPGPELDDAGWTDLVVALRDGLRRCRGLRGEPVRLLEALDSPVLAAGTATLVRAAARRTPVLLDGYGALVCAVLARRLSRDTLTWTLVPQADAAAPHVRRALTSLTTTGVVDLGIRSEDGASALLGLSLLETACGLLRA